MSATSVPDSVRAMPDLEEERRQRIARNQTAITVLRSLVDVDEHEAEEQRETLAYLTRALNEDRLSDRDRF
jgi:hypothetical protein